MEEGGNNRRPKGKNSSKGLGLLGGASGLLKLAISVFFILPFTLVGLEISDTISSKLELKTNICGEAIQISSRADSYGKALNTLREVQKSLKSLEFNFKELSFTAEKRKEEVTAKVVLILKNPKGLSRLLWHLENVKANYPTLVFSLLGKKCFFPTSELERLKQNLRRKLLKEAQKMADIFGQKLGMKCRLDKLQMEEFKLLLPQRVLEGRAKAIWICH